MEDVTSRTTVGVGIVNKPEILTMYARLRVVLVCATVLFAACSDATATRTYPTAAYMAAADTVIRVNECAGPAVSLDPAILGTLPPFEPTIDDKWASIARTVPGGFAGVVTDTATGNPTILLTDTTQQAAAKVALAPIIAQMNSRFDVAHAVVRPARWNADQLLGWYHYLLGAPIWLGHSIWVGANITSTDIAEDMNRILIGTIDATSQVALASRLQSLNLPCSLVVVKVQAPAELAAR